MNKIQLKRAAASLSAQYKNHSWFGSVGIEGDKLVLYVKYSMPVSVRKAAMEIFEYLESTGWAIPGGRMVPVSVKSMNAIRPLEPAN